MMAAQVVQKEKAVEARVLEAVAAKAMVVEAGTVVEEGKVSGGAAGAEVWAVAALGVALVVAMWAVEKEGRMAPRTRTAA